MFACVYACACIVASFPGSSFSPPLSRSHLCTKSITKVHSQFPTGQFQDSSSNAHFLTLPLSQPGRVRTVAGKLVQDEYEWGPTCAQRAAAGYNSGMGEIFRRVAGISPIVINGTGVPQIGAA